MQTVAKAVEFNGVRDPGDRELPGRRVRFYLDGGGYVEVMPDPSGGLMIHAGGGPSDALLVVMPVAANEVRVGAVPWTE